jgi:hypothetical protein
MKPTQRKTFAGISLVVLGMFLHTDLQDNKTISRLHAAALPPITMTNVPYQIFRVLLIPIHWFYQTPTDETEPKEVVSK